jgi:proliferating cell nuclear antigen
MTKGAEEWKAVASAIFTLVEEATFDATPEGITFRAMDPSHVALIDVLWPASAFEKFWCHNETKFGVRMDEFSKLIERADKNDSIVITIPQDGNPMTLNILSTGYKREYKIRLLESTAGSTPLPKLNFDAKIAMTSATFDKILNDIQVVSDYISIESYSEQAVFKGHGDSGDATITLEPGSEGLEELNVKNESKATYSLEYLRNIVKAIKSSVRSIRCEYSSKMPLRLEFQVANVGRVHFFLAPRVEG